MVAAMAIPMAIPMATVTVNLQTATPVEVATAEATHMAEAGIRCRT